jgi:hypothetical protein
MTEDDINYVIYWVKEYFKEQCITSYDGHNTVYHGVSIIGD